MFGVIGRVVDRLNAHLVHLRVGSGQQVAQANALDAYLAALPEQLFADDLYGGELQPTCRLARGSIENWQCDATGWVGTRVAAHGEARGAVVVLHGWLAIELQLAALRHVFAPLRRKGLDVWFPWLPHHGPRTRGHGVSGRDCLSANLVTTTDAVRGAVAETLGLARWLGSRVDSVSLGGYSLGGWVAALAAGEQQALHRLLLWAPVLEPASTLRTSPLARDISAALHGSSASVDHVVELLKRVSPMERGVRMPREDVLLLAARHDNVLQPATAVHFAKRTSCRVEWSDTGHITAEWSPRSRRLARDWLSSIK